MEPFPNKGLFTAEIQMQTNLVFVAVHNSETMPSVKHSKAEQMFKELLWSCQCRKSFWEVQDTKMLKSSAQTRMQLL